MDSEGGTPGNLIFWFAQLVGTLKQLFEQEKQ